MFGIRLEMLTTIYMDGIVTDMMHKTLGFILIVVNTLQLHLKLVQHTQQLQHGIMIKQ